MECGQLTPNDHQLLPVRANGRAWKRIFGKYSQLHPHLHRHIVKVAVADSLAAARPYAQVCIYLWPEPISARCTAPSSIVATESRCISSAAHLGHSAHRPHQCKDRCSYERSDRFSYVSNAACRTRNIRPTTLSGRLGCQLQANRHIPPPDALPAFGSMRTSIIHCYYHLRQHQNGWFCLIHTQIVKHRNWVGNTGNVPQPLNPLPNHE